MPNQCRMRVVSLEQYLAGRYTESTARNYAFEIGRYLARCGGADAARRATYADLVGELERLRGRYPKPATVHRIPAAIRCYYRYLVASGQRGDQPAHRLRLVDGRRRGRRRGRRPQLQDLLSAAELDLLLLAPRPERYRGVGLRDRVIVGLLVHQALTGREVAALTTGDVDLDAAELRVRGCGGTVDRKVPLVASQIMPLHDYLTRERPGLLGRAQPTDHLILTGRGTPERGEGIAYLVETLRPRVPGRRLTAMVIRQSVIAGKLRAGEDLRSVQVFAGHRYISSTEHYRELNLAELRWAVARYHPLDNSPVN